jgi:hypothetical protein
MASSVNALGADWGDKIAPEYFPIDEDHPTRAQDVYSVSKHLAEELADSYARRRSVQIASLRFHWLMRPEDAEATYKANLADTDGANVQAKCKGFWSWTGREFELTLSLSLSLSLPLSLSLSLFLSLYLSLSRARALSHSLPRSLALSLSRSLVGPDGPLSSGNESGSPRLLAALRRARRRACLPLEH